jgi:hypothetical protein
MLGLRGKKSLGAGRDRFASAGLAPKILTPKRLIPILIAGAAALLLAACQVPPHAVKTANTAAPAQSETPETSKAETSKAEAAKSTIAPKATPLATTPAVAHGETILPTATRLSGDPMELVGLDHTALRRVLGKPAQMRNELTAQVWQYVTGDCVIDLYLYDRDGGLKVTYVEARSRTAEPTPTNRCLKSLLERPTASAQ